MEYGTDRAVNVVAGTMREGGAALLGLANATHCTRCHQPKPAHMIGWGTQITRAKTASGRQSAAAVLCPSCHADGSRVTADHEHGSARAAAEAAGAAGAAGAG